MATLTIEITDDMKKYVDRQIAIRIKVAPYAFVSVGFRMRVAYSPVENIGFGVGAPGEPSGPAALLEGIALPGFRAGAGFPEFWNGP